jgi:hypothetical protein
MDLINRYVYAVTKGLPVKQREDIEKELKTLIEDMLEQCDGPEPYEAKLQKVLLDLGDPEVLANNYRESKRYLIGPQNYDNYILILKIVFGAVFLGVSIAFVVESTFSAQKDLLTIFTGYLAGLFSGLLQGFTWVTIAFAIAERNGVNALSGRSEKEAWSLAQLPAIPQKKAVISPAGPIASIVFSTIFITVLYTVPQLFAVYIPDEAAGLRIIPIFDIAMLKGYRLLLACIFIFSVAKEVLKLISGRWTLKGSILFSVLSLVPTILTIIIFSNPLIWNPNFAVEIMKFTNGSFDLSDAGVKALAGFIAVVAIAGIYEISTALYKGVRYNITK